MNAPQKLAPAATFPDAAPPWLVEARKYMGEAEIKGGRHNPLILEWWRAIKRGGIHDDETPWCAAFAGAMLEAAGVRSTRFESAKSYLAWGRPLPAPCCGCVVVFERENGGHVGFVVARAAHQGQGAEGGAGDLLVLGGNQGDCVSVRAFPLARVAGYRWPEGVELPQVALRIGVAVTSGGEA